MLAACRSCRGGRRGVNGCCQGVSCCCHRWPLLLLWMLVMRAKMALHVACSGACMTAWLALLLLGLHRWQLPA